MSARVTEAHEREARELWDKHHGSSWLQDGAIIIPGLIPAIAQALADAEQAEREAIAQDGDDRIADLEAADLPCLAMKIFVEVIRARGTPAKEQADG